MKLISWNVNGLRAILKKDFLEQFEKFDADILCLQEIKLQEDELTAAAFYSKDNLPEIPRKLSIARRLIDWWMENN